MKSFLIVLILFLLRSCSSATHSDFIFNLENENIVLNSLNGNYHITELSGVTSLPFKLNITFNDSKKEFSGFYGCNQFYGNYTIDKHHLKLESLGPNKIICEETSNNIEDHFIKTLQKGNLVFFTKNMFKIYNKHDVLILATKTSIHNPIIFEYSTSTRRSRTSIKINRSTISIHNKRDSKPIEKEISKEKWDTLLTLLRPINLNNLPKLTPPSKDHQFDGAPLAHFKITKGDKTYEVQPFDHGKPHTVIETLVKEILSISENIE